jgi:hypothetical protein
MDTEPGDALLRLWSLRDLAMLCTGDSTSRALTGAIPYQRPGRDSHARNELSLLQFCLSGEAGCRLTRRMSVGCTEPVEG